MFQLSGVTHMAIRRREVTGSKLHNDALNIDEHLETLLNLLLVLLWT
jgi:hypothetical protein